MAGPQGVAGVAGAQGVAGDQGVAGAQGPQGVAGDQGVAGAQGDPGAGVNVVAEYATEAALLADTIGEGEFAIVVTTPPGGAGDGHLYLYLNAAWIDLGLLAGVAGPQGDQGVAGPQGVQGSQGAAGPQGPQGVQGIQGVTGAQGPQGVPGADAVIPDPLTITNLIVTEDVSIWAGQGGGWDDSVGVPQIRLTGANSPEFAAVSGSIFYAHRFDLNDWIQYSYHLLHDYVPGSGLYCHVHWFVAGTAIQSVRWEFSIVVAKGHQQGAFAFATPTVLTVTQSPTGVAHTHMIAEIAAPGFISAEAEIDSIVTVRVRRVTNGGVNNANEVFILMSDLHYKSTGSVTKNKAPNFYA